MDRQILARLSITPTTSILDALKQMDLARSKLLIIVGDDLLFKGLLTVGDIQRAIINSAPLSKPVQDLMRSDLIIASPQDSFETIARKMLTHRLEFCPVVNKNSIIERIVFWREAFPDTQQTTRETFNLPVVIMAGGTGTRLRPITNVLPKPLVPINDKTMLEEIMSRFSHYGVDTFFISVNYKADLIRFYLQQTDSPWSAHCYSEPRPLGTAGSLSLLREKISTTFFVSNCDILIDEEYDRILSYHREHNNEITAVAAIKTISIPYGTLETCHGGQLVRLKEKPEITLKINSGMYVLEPHLLSEIPPGTFYHITHLIEKILERKGRVGVFPVTENAWTDIGDWHEYLKHIREPETKQRQAT